MQKFWPTVSALSYTQDASIHSKLTVPIHTVLQLRLSISLHLTWHSTRRVARREAQLKLHDDSVQVLTTEDMDSTWKQGHTIATSKLYFHENSVQHVAG